MEFNLLRDVDDNLVAIARDADLFICESALPDALGVEVTSL